MFTSSPTIQMLLAQVILCASAAIVIKTKLVRTSVVADCDRLESRPESFNSNQHNPKRNYWYTRNKAVDSLSNTTRAKIIKM